MTLHNFVATLSPAELVAAAQQHFPDTCVRLPADKTEIACVLVTYDLGESLDGRLTKLPKAATVALTDLGWFVVTGHTIQPCCRVDGVADLRRIMATLDGVKINA